MIWKLNYLHFQIFFRLVFKTAATKKNKKRSAHRTHDWGTFETLHPAQFKQGVTLLVVVHNYVISLTRVRLHYSCYRLYITSTFRPAKYCIILDVQTTFCIYTVGIFVTYVHTKLHTHRRKQLNIMTLYLYVCLKYPRRNSHFFFSRILWLAWLCCIFRNYLSTERFM
jgi:hypothetical protein